MIGHIAYSLYKEEKVSWIENHKEKYGEEPTEEEFRNYHESCCSEQRINNYRTMASGILQAFMGGSTDEMAEQVAKDVSEKITEYINDNIATRIPKCERMVWRYFHGSMQSIIGAIVLALLVWLMVAVVSKFSISDFEIEFKKKEPKIENLEKTHQKCTPVDSASYAR